MLRNLVILLLHLSLSVVFGSLVRTVSFVNEITADEAKCGYVLENKVWIQVNEEPGTERTIFFKLTANVPWAKLFPKNHTVANEYEWEEYIVNSELKVPFRLQLDVPGCEPSVNVAFSISGVYSGGICDDEETDCDLTIPTDALSFVTAKPVLNQVSIAEFSVIPGQWSKPVEIRLKEKLLQPEILSIIPVPLLQGALSFRSKPVMSSTDIIEMSWEQRYFPLRTYMYVYADESLGVAQQLEVEYKLQCPQCQFSQFTPKIDDPSKVIVTFEERSTFVPLYYPTMKVFLKYCFTLRLNRDPIIDVSVRLQTCESFVIEPIEIDFRHTPDSSNSFARFCVTPTAESECEINYFLTGEGSDNYITPPSQILNSVDSETIEYIRIEPLTIEIENQKISDPITLTYAASDSVDLRLTPQFIDTKFFTFTPDKLLLIPNSENQTLTLQIFPFVDCPLSAESNISAYYIIDWDINGKLGAFANPPPIYAKVIGTNRMDWCSDEEFDCSNPPIGMTCFPDACVLNPDAIECQPFHPPKKKEINFTIVYIGASCGAVLLLTVILWQFGCLGGPSLPEIDEDKEPEEKRIFNTVENFREAEVAVENLLWQVYRWEQNLDNFKKYENDVHSQRYYDD